MLEWATPYWLLALPLALAAPWLARHPRIAVASLGAVKAPRTLRSLLAFTPRLLGSLGLALLVVAMARPQDVNRERIQEKDGIDIMLVLDTSGSMEARDYEVGRRRASRLSAAKEVIARFVLGRPDDRIGLVVFGEDAFTQVPLTTDGRAMVGFLAQVDIGFAGKRATAIGDAIAVGAQRLEELEAPSKIMILLTDGQSNAGQIDPIEAAQAAAALGIKVYTIGIGGSGGGGGGLFGMLGGGSDLDERTLQRIAQLTDARYFRADDTGALLKVYETIDQLEKTTAEVKEYVHTEERFEAWAWSGLALLMLQALLGETLFRRLP